MEKVEGGERGWAVWFPECIEWWQPRQMIWAEREIHPLSEGKQKGHHGNLQCASLAGLLAITQERCSI